MSGVPNQPVSGGRPGEPSFREIVTDALRFWELMRLAYNALLLAITIAAAWKGTARLDAEKIFQVVFLGIGANVVYCAAYLPDILVQLSDFRKPWRRYRGGLWVLGAGLASVLAWAFAHAIFP